MNCFSGFEFKRWVVILFVVVATTLICWLSFGCHLHVHVWEKHYHGGDQTKKEIAGQDEVERLIGEATHAPTFMEE